MSHSQTAGQWPPIGVDASVAHTARVWNYWLGGKDHFAADREVGKKISQMFPIIAEVARVDRKFLERAVRFLVGEAGIRQFLDIGTGLPTANNTHEVAQAIAPESRIVYVDKDPMVLAFARALLTSSPEGATDYLDADVHNPETILAQAARTLDFTRPVAVVMLDVLNFVLDTGQAQAIVQRLMAAVPSGSFLVLVHPTSELGGGEENDAAMVYWNEHAVPPIRARTGAEVARFFEGLELLEPGLVSSSRWRADLGAAGSVPAEVPEYAGVGQKP